MNVKQLLIYVLPPIFLVPISLFFFVWVIASSPIDSNYLAEEQKALFLEQKEWYQPRASVDTKRADTVLNIKFSNSMKMVSLQTDMLANTIANKFKILSVLDKQSIKYSNIHIELFGNGGLVNNFIEKKSNVEKMDRLIQAIVLTANTKAKA